MKMKTIISGLGCVTVLALAGCHMGPNPLKKVSQKEAISFLGKASVYAGEQTQRTYNSQMLYWFCNANKLHLAMTEKEANQACNQIFTQMVNYAKKQSGPLSDIDVSDLKDQSFFKTISKQYEDRY